ncbi:hypothetical protein [Anaerorhabdus furcosa]|uniref:Lipoprotein n=1 Tax=Anaerorhabdus furcosa TaxID=118967 RepID=A0A1T4PKJ9_9FIRM|nr:hypothetical protein [Anaerorhabdus furcosa]SJZ92114.1 hypothetical protein SAMN02745191_2088 [Anaerorhabdus furcosa]
MRKLVLYLLVALTFVSGCSKKKNEIAITSTANEKLNFEVIEFRAPSIESAKSNKYEFREIYNNSLPIIELVEHENYYSSEELYLMNLESNDIKQIQGIKKVDVNNRIWSFVEISENEFIYIELAYDELEGDNSLIKYTINYSNSNMTKELFSGNCYGIYNLPIFMIKEDKLFISGISNYENNGKIDSYYIYFGEINENGLEILYSNESKVVNNQLSNDAEILYGTTLILNEESILFFTEINNTRFMNIYKDGKVVKYSLNNQGIINYSIPVNGYLICNEFVDNKENYYLLNSNLEKVKDIEKISISDFAITKYGTYIINEKGLYFLYLSDDKSELIVKKVERIVNPIYFRVVNENDTLVFTDNGINRINIKK